MILDVDRFVEGSQHVWKELEARIERLEREPGAAASLEEIERFHYLYRRAASDLARLAGLSSIPEVTVYLESLVGRAYAEIHETRGRSPLFSPLSFLSATFPRTLRKHRTAMALSVIATLVGVLFGALALLLDPEAREALMPFPQLLDDPRERVAREERAAGSGVEGAQASFSSDLMTHNIRVSLLALGLGASWGAGTIVLLFYNGVTLGAVVADYVRASEGTFVAAWLLPHGVVEIPAILVAGQAGLVIAGAMLGGADRRPVAERLRAAGPDVMVLAGGLSAMLVWAGIVESFLSQLHEPYLPYAAKIGVGIAELCLLALWWTLGGRRPAEEPR